MKYDRSFIAFTICLSALAGYVDAIGFLNLGGFFISFMSGNSTRLAVAIAGGIGGQEYLAAAIIALFVSGVVIGSLVNHFSNRNRSPAVLSLVALFLAGGATCHEIGWNSYGIILTIMAMGAENAIFQKDGEVSIGLTYMTGTLVKMGVRIANALVGGPKFIWVRYFLMWFSLVCGAVLGAIAHAHMGLTALWFAALAATFLIWPSMHFRDRI